MRPGPVVVVVALCEAMLAFTWRELEDSVRKVGRDAPRVAAHVQDVQVVGRCAQLTRDLGALR